MFSFYSDDSFDPLDCGPDMCTIKKKPFIVPSLNLHNLPEYETSSEEGEEEGEEDDYYIATESVEDEDDGKII